MYAADVAPLVGTEDASAAESPQASEPVTVMAKARKGRAPRSKGDRFLEVSATGSNDVPEAALRAYKNAASAMSGRAPACQLPWTLLAGIGRVESDHGRFGDSVLGSDGVSRPAILGLPLNGVGPVAAIHDTDGGRLDGDRVWDRAVGQMQFIPSTWRMVASDGDSNGTELPNDIDDAALGAGRYLCAGGYSVAEQSGMARAVYSYNHSDYYVALVMAFEKGYRTGVFVIPSPPPPPGADDGMPSSQQAENGKKGTRHPHASGAKPHPAHQSGHHSGHHPGNPGPGKPGGADPKPAPPPSPSPSPSPSPTPSPTPKPSPSPSPQPPQLVGLNGPWSTCGADFCVNGTHLALGPDGQLSRQAKFDYDGDGSLETNRTEFADLAAAGAPAQLQVALDGDGAVVYTIGGKDYRYADGTFA